MRCGVTRKVGFKTHAGALNRAAKIMQQENSGESNRRVTPEQWRAYKCEFCGLYHLTGKVLNFIPRDDMDKERYDRRGRRMRH